MSDTHRSTEGGTSPNGAASGRAGEDNWFARLKAALGRRNPASLRASLADVLAEGEAGEDVFSAQERAMLRNILALKGKRVVDVMVPRADIVAVSEETSLADTLAVFREAGHSRLPLYREGLDDPVGVVHIKDLMSYLLSGAVLKSEEETRRRRRTDPLRQLAKVDFTRTLASAKVSRAALFVPPSMPAVDLLVQMQTTRVHMALVIDEYGGTDGLITIEDLVEEVVGDIEDEHDFDEAPLISPRAEGGYVADARADLEDVGTAIGVPLDLGEEAEDVDTLGGLIVTLAGRVPVRGELIAGPGNLEFEVLDADPRRVKRIGIHLRRGGEPAGRSRPRRSLAAMGETPAQAEAVSAAPQPEPDPTEGMALQAAPAREESEPEHDIAKRAASG